MRVESLLSGPLEPTSEAYALAKLTGLKLCQAYWREKGARFIGGIAADVFGPGDDFSPAGSHVLGALLSRMHEAKVGGLSAVEIWGTGAPRREFLFADDLASACLFVMERYDEPTPINLGGGTDLSIRELAERIRAVVGFAGELRFNPRRPDGMPRKLLDSGPLLALGWQRHTDFGTALGLTYQAFLATR